MAINAEKPTSMTTIDDVYKHLKSALRRAIEDHCLVGEEIDIQCRALSAREAIGSPEHQDYPIIKGKEVMVEAVFKGAAGQAFTDEFKNASFPVETLLTIDAHSTADRALFIAGLNAVFRHLGLCEKTVHCRDEEPVDCARELAALDLYSDKKVLLVGLQPRFLEYLAQRNQVRVVDLDPDNVNQERCGVLVETADRTDEALDWCDSVFVTGSTIVNGTITRFINQPKPVAFFGVTISAAACILALDSYCHCGH